MSVYKETKPEIWTVMGFVDSNTNTISKIIHAENLDNSFVSTICGITRLKIPTPYFNCTRNMSLVTCKKCLKHITKNKINENQRNF